MVQTKQAFTLIELLVVVLIIGILATVALPQYQRAVEKSRATQALVFVKALSDAQEIYFLANGEYATTDEMLDIDISGTGESNSQNYRKVLKDFKFAIDVDSGNIATAFRIRDGRSDYAFRKFAADPHLYCIPQTLNDSLEVCKSFSGGLTNDKGWYIVK